MAGGPEFQQAVKESRQLSAKPSNDELLELYAYFKQVQQDPPFEKATAPGTFNFKEKYKYQKWEQINKEGVTPQQAEEKYVKLVNTLKDKYGFDPNKAPEAVGGK